MAATPMPATEAERIRTVRELAHLSIEDTALLAHIRPERLEAIEAGTDEALCEELEDLAYALGVTTDFLLDTDGGGGLAVKRLAMKRRRELDALRPLGYGRE